MGFKSAFGKIGKGIGLGALKAGRILAKVDDIPGAGTVIAMIPIAGSVLALAAKRCDMAEGLFDPGQGEKKKAWARNKLAVDLRKIGIEEKYIDDLTSVGLLVAKHYAMVLVAELEKKGKPKGKSAPKGPPKEKKPPKGKKDQAGGRTAATVDG